MVFHCKICPDKKYTTLANLNRHLLSEHGEDNRMVTIVCPLKCQTIVKDQQKLLQHLKEKHGFDLKIEEIFFKTKEGKLT